MNRERKLTRRIRRLEARVAQLEVPEQPRFRGAPLTASGVADYYASLRASGHRFAKLRIHPDLQDAAEAVLAEVGGELRGLREVELSGKVPECGWEVVAG